LPSSKYRIDSLVRKTDFTALFCLRARARACVCVCVCEGVQEQSSLENSVSQSEELEGERHS